jgi:hypothetical protein
MGCVCVSKEASSSIYCHGNISLERYSMHVHMQPSWRSHLELPHVRRMRVMRLGTFKDLYKHQVASIASSLIPCDKSSEQILPRNELSRSMMQL